MEGMISLQGRVDRIGQNPSYQVDVHATPGESRAEPVLLRRAEYGEWSSHMMQCRLQSSGLVSKVIRHGPDFTPDGDSAAAIRLDVRSHYPPLCRSRLA